MVKGCSTLKFISQFGFFVLYIRRISQAFWAVGFIVEFTVLQAIVPPVSMSSIFILKLAQHLSRIFCCLDLSDRFYYNAVFVYKVCCSYNAHRNLSVIFLFFPDVIGLYCRKLRIGKNCKRKVIFLFKAFMRSNAVLAYTDNDSIFFCKQRIKLTEAASLLCTACCIIFRVKIEYYLFSSVFLQ